MRHGETTGQSSLRYYGATDVPLSAEGEEQMRRAGAELAGQQFAAVYSSRLCRARRGAELIAGGNAAQPVAAFDEVHFGRWEGLTRDEIRARDAAEFAHWQADPERFAYPEGECRLAFHRRVADGLATVLADAPGAHLLFVVHRGTIAVTLTELLDLDATQRRALQIDLGSIHELTRDDAGWRAVRINHIPAERREAARA